MTKEPWGFKNWADLAGFIMMAISVIIILAALLMVSCDGTYEVQEPIAPIGQPCDPHNLPKTVPGAYVCSQSDFLACCEARPEKFALTCAYRDDVPRYYIGFCP